MNRQDLQKKLQDTREAIFVAIATMDSQKKELEQVCASSPEAKKRALAIHTQFMETKSRLATLHALQDDVRTQIRALDNSYLTISKGGGGGKSRVAAAAASSTTDSKFVTASINRLLASMKK